MPLLLTPPPPPPPPSLDDDERRLALDEMRNHCAPSTWDAFVRSLRARDYPLPLDAYLAPRSN